MTGGGRGLGLVIALCLVESGADVACLDLLPQPDVVTWGELLCASALVSNDE